MTNSAAPDQLASLFAKAGCIQVQQVDVFLNEKKNTSSVAIV